MIEPLERSGELARIENALADAREGRGRFVVVEGRAGIGKTAVVDMARVAAEANGMRVVRARATELERHFAYGVVRQLFEPALFSASEDERRDLLQGDAAVAAALLGLPGASSPDYGIDRARDTSFVILHGLYWLLATLSAQRPVLLVVDDIHCADAASLRFLVFLLPRLEELQVAVIVATRSTAAQAEETPLAKVLSDASADVITLAPLSDDGAARLLETALGEPAAPLLIAAFMNATGGMPPLVHGVVDGLREEGILPSEEAAHDVERIGVEVARKAVRSQLNNVSANARALAHAFAVLRQGALLDATRLASLDELEGSAAHRELVSAGILRDAEPLAFAHVSFSAAIYDDLPALERVRLHYDAARQLAPRSAMRDVVAEHLLASAPRGDAWVAQTVVSAARAAAASGAPVRAAVLYRRALAEPPQPEDESGLLLELGCAEASAGLDGWDEHLQQAVENAPAGAQRVNASRHLARALNRDQRFGEAVEVLDGAAAALGEGDEELRLQLEAAAVVVGMNDPTPAGANSLRRAALLARAAADSQPPAELLGAAAFVAVIANEPADSAAALARRAMMVAGNQASSSLFARAIFTLLVAEQYDEVRPLIEESIKQARRTGDGGRLAAALASRAWLALRRGDLGAAEIDARTALVATELPAPPVYRALNGGVLLKALVDQGELESADSFAAMLCGDAESQSITAAVLRLARGRLRLEQGDAKAALADFLAVGDLLTHALVECPGYLPWRSEASHAHLALGEQHAAVELAEAELALAKSFGAPRTVGFATRALALAVGGDRGAALLREAIDAFGQGGALLERGRALADLGAALRRRNQRVTARTLLREALDIAHRCGAKPLIAYADTELRATGARPRHIVLTGPDSLTASERRVAELAKLGMTNREIAQMLFVTARTVEGHLTGVFRKLQVASRTDLDAALAGDDAG